VPATRQTRGPRLPSPALRGLDSAPLHDVRTMMYMEPIVLATWGLVAVTALLVFVGWRQGAEARKDAATRAAREDAQLAALREQALALGAAAAAQHAVANEMLEARKAANPLRVVVERDPKAAPGIFQARIRGAFGVATVLHRVAIHVGQGPRVPEEPVVVRDNGNAYLTGNGA